MSIAEPVPITVGPTHLDLPHTDDKPVENAYQPLQSALLSGSLVPWLDRLHPDGNYYVGADNGIYWRATAPPENGCRAPDWFYVANVPRLLGGEFRRSYVMWQEVIAPLIVVEYVSGDGSEERDRTPYSGKLWVYEQAIRATYYAIWDPQQLRLEVFELVRAHYQPMAPNEHSRFLIPEMELELGVWEGEYQNHPGHWLRGWDLNGRILPSPEESGEEQRQRAEREKQRAEHEKQRAEHEKQRADKLAAKLRELGVDPEQD